MQIFIINKGLIMSYETRKKLYEQIKKERKNPLIVYVTSIRPNLSSQMAKMLYLL